MEYALSKEEVLKVLKSNEETGLTAFEAKQRIIEYGLNQLTIHKTKSIFTLFTNQILDPMVGILFVSTILSILMKEYMDALIILIVIIFNAVFSMIQEYKAEKTMEGLQELSIPHTMVKRDGIYTSIESKYVTIGDIVTFSAGNYISCDARILKNHNLVVDESALTGESEYVYKNDTYVYNKETVLADRKNMCHASCFVISGSCEAVCVNVGMHTEVGEIAGLLQNVKEDITPLQKRYQTLGKMLGIMAIGISILIFVIGWIQKREILSLLMTAISLAVASIPEGLTAVITVILAIGMKRMSKVKAVARKMQTVETLGSIDTICTDKTGTLTQNRMKVVEYVAPYTEKISKAFINTMYICNSYDANKEDYLQNATDVALHHFSKKYIKDTFGKVYEVPFDSNRKYMIVVCKEHNIYACCMKGAWEVILGCCNKIEVDDVVRPLQEKDRLRLLEIANSMSSKSLRILGVCRKEILTLDTNNLDTNYIFLGFIGLMDPLKEEVYETLAVTKAAGIDVIMITGDHASTALAIAKELHLANYEHEVIIGSELDTMQDDVVLQRLEKVKVFARVTPQHKLRIVQLLKKQGKMVAMTGDGVNDAIALKQADVGISMGLRGTDVAKEASDLVLMDDNFQTIVKAVEEGRGIFRNIQKVIVYLLSCNIGECISLLGSMILLSSYPLLLHPIQILWINIITDTLPAFALGIEPKDKDLMYQKPVKNQFISKAQIFDLFFNGLLIASMTLIAYKYGLQISIETANTLAFITLSITQLFHAYNVKHFSKSIFKYPVLNNRSLNCICLLSILLQIFITESKYFQTILHITSIPLNGWILVFVLSTFIIFMNEGLKIFRKHP